MFVCGVNTSYRF
jgi:hypothetical protein